MDIGIYDDPIYINLHVNSSGKPVSQRITSERKMVYKNIIVLNEIPDEYYKVSISGMTEVKQIETINDFKVDYTYGKVYFHPDIEDNTEIIIDRYYGKGNIFIPFNRFYENILVDGTISTLEDYFSSINYMYVGKWNSYSNYRENNQVFYEGTTYICIKNCQNIIPTNTSYWRVFGAGLRWKGKYSSSIRYYTRDIVESNNYKWYICERDCIDVELTDNKTWRLLVDFSDIDNQYKELSKLLSSQKDTVEDTISNWEDLQNDVLNITNDLIQSSNRALSATDDCIKAREEYIKNVYKEILIYKELVQTYDEMLEKYSNPENGWTIKVVDDDSFYRYDGEKKEWQWIDASSPDKHRHTNKEVLDQIGESSNGKFTYKGNTYVDHTHDNKDTLDKFSILNGKVLIDGKAPSKKVKITKEIYDFGTKVNNKIKTLLRSEYDDLSEKDEDTIYITTGAENIIFKGEIELTGIENVLPRVQSEIGDLNNLITENKEDIVKAICEVNGTVLDLTSVQNEIDELEKSVNATSLDIGDLNDLTTSNKTSLVSAINELKTICR